MKVEGEGDKQFTQQWQHGRTTTSGKEGGTGTMATTTRWWGGCPSVPAVWGRWVDAHPGVCRGAFFGEIQVVRTPSCPSL